MTINQIKPISHSMYEQNATHKKQSQKYSKHKHLQNTNPHKNSILDNDKDDDCQKNNRGIDFEI